MVASAKAKLYPDKMSFEDLRDKFERFSMWITLLSTLEKRCTTRAKLHSHLNTFFDKLIELYGFDTTLKDKIHFSRFESKVIIDTDCGKIMLKWDSEAYHKVADQDSYLTFELDDKFVDDLSAIRQEVLKREQQRADLLDMLESNLCK
jgi:hypothetical protein